jgi:histone-lysine N-methyltransferase SETD1
VFHDPFGENCKIQVEELTTERKTIVPVPSQTQPPLAAANLLQASFALPELVPSDFPLYDATKQPHLVEDEKYLSSWPASSNNSKYKDEWDYNATHRSSKYEEDYEYSSRSVSSKYDKYDRKERDYSSSRYRRDDDRHRRGDRDRRDYSRHAKDDWKDRERSRKDYYDYPRSEKDNHRYGSGSGSKKYVSRSDSYNSASEISPYGTSAYDSSTYGNFSTYGSYPPFPSSSATSSSSAGIVSSSQKSGWVPLPPPIPNDSSPKPPMPEPSDWQPKPPVPPSDDIDAADRIKLEDGESTVDLDTRIEMLFKTKSFESEIPSFIAGNLDETEETEECVEDSKSNNKHHQIVQENENNNSSNSELHQKFKANLSLNENSESSSSIIKSEQFVNDVKRVVKVEKEEYNDDIKMMEDGELNDDKFDSSDNSDGVNSGTEIPSPYESRSAFKINAKFMKSKQKQRRSKERKVKVDSDASDISSSEDELLAKGSYSPLLPPRKISSKQIIVKDEDQMSLSSLSSTEPVKSESEIKSEFNSLNASTYGIHGISSYSNYNYYNHQFSAAHNHQWNHYDYYNYASGDSSRVKSEKDVQNNTDTGDPNEYACKKVIEKLIQELKQILKKDINKRMIESTAFKKYEAWWDEQQRNKNTRNSNKIHVETTQLQQQQQQLQSTSSTFLHPSLTSARDPMVDSYHQQSGSLGILRNFRIQRIKRESKPIHVRNNVEEEDSRKSDPDDDDMVRGSDTEEKDIQLSSRTSSYISKRKISTSSSDSSDTSDSSEQSDEEEEEQERDDHVYSSDTASFISDDDDLSIAKKVTTVSKKDKENNRIYSDSDSELDDFPAHDQLAIKSTDVVKQKLKIYSSEDDDESDNDDESSSSINGDQQKPEKKEKEKEREKEDDNIKKSTSATSQSSDREKTPDGKETPTHPPAESDSDFFNDDVISKPPRTPGRTSSDDQVEKEVEKITSAKAITPSKQKSPQLATASSAAVKNEFTDRVYSDSEEEREYQERIRRNTEYMEQIEREAKEELERMKSIQQQQPQKQNQNQVKGEPMSTDTSRAASPVHQKQHNKLEIKKPMSFDEPFTPTTTIPPPTPVISLHQSSSVEDHQSMAINSSENLQDSSSKKKRGRPKGSLGKPKENKQQDKKTTKNGAITKSSNVVDNDNNIMFAQPQTLKAEVEQKYSLKLSPSSSSDGGSSQASLVAMEHCYSLPPSASPSPSQEMTQAMRHLDHDHGYYGVKSETNASTPLQSIQPAQLDEQQQSKKDQVGSGARPVGRPRKDPNAPKAAYTRRDKNVTSIEKHNNINSNNNTSSSAKERVKEKVTVDARQHKMLVENFVPIARYNKRSHSEEFDVLCRFLTQGIDQEDVDYMKRAYTYLIQNDIPGTELLHQVHWVDHCATDRSFVPAPPKKRKRDDLPELRQHQTGCARTEGFYKIDSKEKAHYKYHHLKGTVAGSHLETMAKVAKMQNASREARSNQRRLLTAFGGATESDLLKFNQLKFRKKQLKFAKSAIHDWGLFAMEPIAADEMVIEYVGQMVRPSIADLRETKYEAIGIGSSYLFRIDLETIIDATKCGNLARFINHSCNVSNF